LKTKPWYKNLWWIIPGMIAGGIGGYFYWKFYGCDGTCLITSSPVRSVIYFAGMGVLVNQMFKPSRKSTTDISSAQQETK
jgi:hypothetical protein